MELAQVMTGLSNIAQDQQLWMSMTFLHEKSEFWSLSQHFNIRVWLYTQLLEKNKPPTKEEVEEKKAKEAEDKARREQIKQENKKKAEAKKEKEEL